MRQSGTQTAEAKPHAALVESRCVNAGEIGILVGGGWLETPALGSSVCVFAYHPEARVGGLFHFMLAESTVNPAMAERDPLLFADTGIEVFLAALVAEEVEPVQMQFRVTGGAAVSSHAALFEVGRQNQLAACRELRGRGLRLARMDVGGRVSRTVSMDVATGEISVVIPGRKGFSL